MMSHQRLGLIPLALVLSLLICVQHINSAPLQLQNDDSGVVNLAYKVGDTYVYDFNSEVITKLVGTSDEESKIKVKSQVALKASSPTEYVLTVQSASLETTGGQAVNAGKLVGSSIGFTNDNGRLKCSIKLEKDDPTWSANIKRAIISHLTNHAFREGEYAGKSYSELDVSGYNCLTTYTIDGTKYVRSRDLNTCAKRDGGFVVSLATVYTVDESDSPQSDQSLKSEQECTQIFDSGILKSADCTETHVLDFFTNEDAGVTTTVKSSLTYASTGGSAKSPTFDTSSEKKIFFDFTDEDKDATATHGTNALALLKDLCKEVTSIITTSEVSETFLRLRREISKSDEAGISAAYNGLKGGSICADATAKDKVTKLFLRALAYAGTSDSIAFFSTLYKNDDVVDHRAKMSFRINMAFAQRPKENALTAVLKLITADACPKLVLSASGLAHQYCHANSKCEESSAYKDLVGAIANYASSNCLSTDGDQLKKAIAGLQALGNLHDLTSNGEAAVVKCLGGNDRVKVNALQAFRRNACSAEPKKKANEIFADRKVAVHVRLQAYLAVSRCLSREEATTIAEALKDPQELDQVKAYVCTHVANRLDTVSAGRTRPAEQDIFGLIKCTEIKRDIRKYSVNLESSHYAAVDNTGYSVEGNVMYSPDSFLPKFISTNFTFDHAGKSYNLVEFGINTADYEEYLDSIFGPNGKKPQDIDIPLAKYYKSKRAVEKVSPAPTFNQASLDSFSKSISTKRVRETKGVTDLYLRLFGTTIATKSFTLDEYLTFKSKKGKSNADKFKELFINKNLEFADQIPYVSDELIVPTTSGLPLRIGVDGSVILSMKLNNKLDEGSLTFSSETVGSATSLARAKHTVGAGSPLEAGLQLELKIHGTHNSVLSLKTKRDDVATSVEALLTFPDEAIRTFEMSNKFYWFESKNSELPTKRELKYSLASDDYKTRGTTLNFPGGSTIISAKYPNPSLDKGPKFPLSGPIVLAASLMRDPKIKDVLIKAEYKQSKDGANTDFSLAIDTPGAESNLKCQFAFSCKKPSAGNTEVEAAFSNAQVKASVALSDKTAGTSNDKEIKASLNGQDYGVKIHSDLTETEEKISGTTVTSKIKFDATYYSPGGKGTLLKGTGLKTTKTENDQVSGKITLTAETEMKAKSETSGTIEWEKKKDGSGYKYVLTDIKGSHGPLGELTLNGKISKSKPDQTFFSDLSAKYGAKGERELNVVFNFDKSQPDRTLVESKLISSARPEINFEGKWERNFGAGHKKVSLDINRGNGETTFVASGDLIPKADGFTYTGELTAQCKKSKKDFSLSGKADKDGSHLYSDFTVKSGALNAVSTFEGDYVAKSYNFKSTGQGAGKGFTYTSSLTTAGNTKTHKVNIDVPDSFDVDISTDYTTEDAKISLVSVINSKKLLTQPITLRQELYAASSFSGKDRSVKKSVSQALIGTNRVTSLTLERTGANVKVDFYQLNQLEAKFEVELSKGALVLDTDVNIPSKRRVISNFEIKGSKAQVDITTEIKWDANADPTKVLSFKSSTTRSGININSKNTIDVSGDKRELNIETKLEPQLLNADHAFEIDYIKGGKTYSVGAEHRVDFTDKTKGIKSGLKVELPGQTPLHFRLESKITDVDFEKYFFDYSLFYEGDISDDSGKDQFLKVNLVRKAVNSGRHTTLEASARIISEKPKGVSLDVHVEKNGLQVKYTRKDDDKKVASFEADLSRDASQPLKTLSVKFSYDKDFGPAPTASADATYKYTFNSFKDFQVHEVFNLGYKGDGGNHVTSGENTLTIAPNLFAFKTISKYQKPNQSPVTIQDLEVSAGLTNGKYNLLLDVRNLFTVPGTDKPSSISPKLEVVLEPKLPSFNLVLSADRVPAVRTVEIKLDHDEGGQKRTTNVNVKIADQSGSFTSVLEFTKAKSATDFTVKINNDAEKKLSIVVQDTGSGPTAEASVVWGDKPNESIKTKGNVVKSANGGFDADLVFDKTPVSSKWTMKVKRTVVSDQNAQFELNAESSESNQQIKVSVDRNINLAAQSTIKATYDIKLAKYTSGEQHSGNFQLDLDRKAFDPATEKKGDQLTIDFEAKKDNNVLDKSKIVVKISDNEKRLTISSACDKPYCIDANVQLKTSENAASMELTTVKNGLKTGMVVEGSKAGRTYKSDVQVFFARGGKQEDFSCYVFKGDGEASDIDLIKSEISAPANSISRMGFDISLDDRKISVISASGQWNSPQATSCQLNVWLDKARKPADKLAWSITSIPKNNDNERNFIWIHQAPNIERNFRVKTTRKLDSNPNNFDGKLELDVYKRKEDTIFLSFKKDSSDPTKDIFDINVNSEGQGISMKENCVVDTAKYSTDCSISLKSPGVEDSTYKFFSSYDKLKAVIKCDQLTPEKRSYWYEAEFNELGCPKQVSYAVPGFPPGDSHTIKIEKSDVPSGYHFRSGFKSEGDDYTDLFVGHVIHQGLGIKLTRTEKGATNDLLEIRRVENSTHLRSYEFIWNAENIKKSLTRLETLALQNSDNLAKLLKSRADVVGKTITGLYESLKKSRVDLNPAIDFLKNEIQAIGSELKVDSSGAVAKLEAYRTFVNAMREKVPPSMIAKTLNAIGDFVANSKGAISKCYGTFRNGLDALAKAKDLDLEVLFEKQVMALVRQAYAKFKTLNDYVSKEQEKNANLDYVAKIIRSQLSSRYADFNKANEKDIYKFFPYPETKVAFEPIVSYIKQRIATPEKKTLNDDFREMMFSKMDAAFKVILANTVYTNFAAGHAVVNIPIFTRGTTLKRLLAVSKHKSDLGDLWKLRKHFPAPGYGMIYGTKEFKTFDGVLVPFETSGQYLLASDFTHNEFTVAIDIVKGEGETKSIYIADKNDKAIITQNGDVYLNGKRAIGGAKAGKLEVIREGNWVGVVREDAFGISCQSRGLWTNANVLPCIVRISGYYHDEVKGLLGYFNHESTDDNPSLSEWKLK